jgi:MFS superfamily sulfate permease-like transporter
MMMEMFDAVLGDHPELVVLGVATLALLLGISWLGNQRAILLPVLIVSVVVAALLTLGVFWRWRRSRGQDQRPPN